jgi:hypothetical protein
MGFIVKSDFAGKFWRILAVGGCRSYLTAQSMELDGLLVFFVRQNLENSIF